MVTLRRVALAPPETPNPPPSAELDVVPIELPVIVLLVIVRAPMVLTPPPIELEVLPPPVIVRPSRVTVLEAKMTRSAPVCRIVTGAELVRRIVVAPGAAPT